MLRPAPGIHTAMAILSGTTLVYEIALMRVFSVTLWYFFAFFVTAFLAGGFAIAAIVAFFPPRMATLYWADLGGAAIGCLAVVPLLWIVPAPGLLAAVGILPLAAAAILRRELGGRGPSWRIAA